MVQGSQILGSKLTTFGGSVSSKAQTIGGTVSSKAQVAGAAISEKSQSLKAKFYGEASGSQAYVNVQVQ